MKLKLPKEYVIKSIPYPRGFEKQLESFMVKMTSESSKYYFNNTIKKLNKGTISKFSDAQLGNWATIFNKLDSSAKIAIRKRYNKSYIDKNVKRILSSLNVSNQKAFYSSIESVMGINISSMIAQEGTGPSINALIIETQRWVHKNLDDNLSYFANNTLRMMADGSTYDKLIQGYDSQTAKQISQSKFIARNQLSSFNGLSNKIRYQKLGITQAKWQTSKDERVRKSHDGRHNKIYDLDKGCYSSKDGKWLYPGTDHLCRCTSRAIIPKYEKTEQS